MSVFAKIILGDSRAMPELENESIDLIITSPPYWHIKNYGTTEQIGYGQSLHEYLKDLFRVWQESFRVLKAGRRLCINIGDQFARSIIYGRYKIIPIHAEIINQCERIGFDYMGSIIWQKKTTMNTTGGASVMGSYPYPPNGMVEIDYEYILIFKKPGKSSKIPKEIKEKSALTKDEWKQYFYGHWYFGGAKQTGHEAMFPDELPRRLIKMFSFVGETVLDPFLGSGTTAKVALSLNRNAVGYEINPEFLPLIKKKLGLMDNSLGFVQNISFISREEKITPSPVNYVPSIQDARPKVSPEKLKFNKERLYKVVEILSADKMKLNTGLIVKLLGVNIQKADESIEYLKKYVLKKEVFLKFDDNGKVSDKEVEAYVYLKNKIFVNAYLIKSGMAKAEREREYLNRKNFLNLEAKVKI